MKKLIDVLTKEAEIINTGGNEPFVINDADSVWFVLNGGIELFSTQFDGTAPIGQRYHFATIDAQQIIIGMDITKNGNGWAILAVPANNTKLLKIKKSLIDKLLCYSEYRNSIISLIDAFLIKLLSGLSQDINPRADVLCSATTEITLENSRQMRSASGLVWVKFVSGQGIFLDMEYVAENNNGDMFFPLSQDTWITAAKDSAIKIYVTDNIVNRIWIFFEYFEKILFQCESLNRHLLKADELNRLRDKVLHNEKTYNDTFNELSAIFQDELKAIITTSGNDALLAACRLIGNNLGIKINDYNKENQKLTADLALKEITKASRIRIRPVKLAGEWWAEDVAPLLCFFKGTNNPAAILKVKNKNVIYDTVTNEQKKLTKEIAGEINYIAYAFYKPFPEKIISGFEALKFSLANIKKELMFVIFMGLIAGIISAIIPLAGQTIINKIIPAHNYAKLLSLGIALLLAVISGALFEICRNLGLLKVEAKIDSVLQAAIIDRLLKLPVSFFYKYSSGDLSERTLSIFTIRQILSGQTVITILGILFSVFNLILLFYFAGWLAIAVLAIIFLALIINLCGNLFQMKYLYPAINLEGKISSMIFQFIGGISKIKIARAEIHSFANWVSKFSEQQKLIINSRKIVNLLLSFNQIFPIILILIIFVVIDFFNIKNFGLGEFVGFNTAMMAFVYAMMTTCVSIMMLVYIRPLYDRIKPILNEPLEIDESKISVKKLRGSIEICNVSYKYSNDGPVILDNVSMDISPGEYVAIVGPSGSGKSTLLKLLLGFDKPATGAILYDKQDLAAVDLRSVRQQLGVILQNSQLMQGDILSNIIGSKKLTFEDAWEAAYMAGIAEDIEEMPMGMKTIVTVGNGTFSGGQKQRILIARALVSKPRIIFFDEATSALDNRSQSIVIENLEKLQSTRIVIAHRISTIAKADKIFVLEKGKIIQAGKYAELFNQPGLFRELALRQRAEA